MRKLLAVAIAISIIFLAGCSWFKAKTIEAPAPSISPTITITENNWSIEDNRTIAAKFVNEALNADWLKAFIDQNKRNPVVMVKSVVNMTDEHLPIDGFVKDISRELLKSGKVRLVTIREDHLENTDESQREPVDSELGMAEDSGADFAFKGLIERTGNLEPGARSKLYRAELLLIDLKKGEPIWKTEAQIQKQNSPN